MTVGNASLSQSTIVRKYLRFESYLDDVGSVLPGLRAAGQVAVLLSSHHIIASIGLSEAEAEQNRLALI